MKHLDATTDSITTFGLLRHGQTEWNVLKRVQGSADSPLTATGQKETAEWGRTLTQFSWNRIMCSDLGRVQETVAILNRTLSLPVTVDRRLREQYWGEWEGLTLPYIYEHFQDELSRRVARGWEFAAPGGESRSAVRTRVLAALEEAAKKWQGQKILVVCHQGVIKSLLYSLTNREFLPGEDPLLQHNKLHLIDCEAGRFRPGKLNIPRVPET
ncbi:MAG: histidine phosphatase family protein [Desulforhopalus sp.]